MKENLSRIKGMKIMYFTLKVRQVKKVSKPVFKNRVSRNPDKHQKN